MMRYKGCDCDVETMPALTETSKTKVNTGTSDAIRRRNAMYCLEYSFMCRAGRIGELSSESAAQGKCVSVKVCIVQLKELRRSLSWKKRTRDCGRGIVQSARNAVDY